MTLQVVVSLMIIIPLTFMLLENIDSEASLLIVKIFYSTGDWVTSLASDM